eukprot:7710514-Lingulodinium_polyedra.AAC.1
MLELDGVPGRGVHSKLEVEFRVHDVRDRSEDQLLLGSYLHGVHRAEHAVQDLMALHGLDDTPKPLMNAATLRDVQYILGKALSAEHHAFPVAACRVGDVHQEDQVLVPGELGEGGRAPATVKGCLQSAMQMRSCFPMQDA